MTAALLALTLAFPFPGKKPAPDRWLAEDKLKHFFAGFVATSLSASAARVAGLPPASSAWVGAGVGAGFSAWKEVRDARTGRGTASAKDLAWDAAGIAAASALVRQVQ